MYAINGVRKVKDEYFGLQSIEKLDFVNFFNEIEKAKTEAEWESVWLKFEWVEISLKP